MQKKLTHATNSTTNTVEKRGECCFTAQHLEVNTCVLFIFKCLNLVTAARYFPSLNVNFVGRLCENGAISISSMSLNKSNI